MTETARPTATLEDVWRERAAWGLAARQGKSKQQRARKAALLLGFAGGLFGAVAASLETIEHLGSPWPQIGFVAGVLSAILLALGGYFGRELLTPDRETLWARARLLAEALKRECWRYQMAVPPYDGIRGHDTLRARAVELASNRGLERPLVSAPATDLPQATTVDAYLAERVDDQIAFYERTGDQHRRQRDRLNRLSFVLGAAAVVLGVIGSTKASFIVFVPVATTAMAVLVAWIQGTRLGSMIPLYQETASQLRLQAASWHDEAALRTAMTDDQREAAEARLVERCEEIMARENGAWRAEWLSEEKALEAAESLDRAQKVARGETASPASGGTAQGLPAGGEE